METRVVGYSRIIVSIICAGLLFIALLHLPIWYYRFLRVVVFIGALLVIHRNSKEWLFWSILFVAIAILFNPILPIYLYRRSIWMPLDIIVGILFLLEGFLKKEKKQEVSKVNMEVKMLYEFAKERSVSKDHLDKILLHSNDSIELIPEGVVQKIEYLCDFATMIWADNVVTNDERSMLEKYIKSFGFLDENIAPLATYLLDAVKAGKTKQEIFNELNN